MHAEHVARMPFRTWPACIGWLRKTLTACDSAGTVPPSHLVHVRLHIGIQPNICLAAAAPGRCTAITPRLAAAARWSYYRLAGRRGGQLERVLRLGSSCCPRCCSCCSCHPLAVPPAGQVLLLVALPADCDLTQRTAEGTWCPCGRLHVVWWSLAGRTLRVRLLLLKRRHCFCWRSG